MTTPTPLPIPWSQEAEDAVIGSVLISPSTLPTLQGFLQARHFFLVRHRIAWNAFLALSGRGDVIDLVSVTTYLKEETQQFDEVGGYAGLVKLISECPDSTHAETYGKLVHRLSVRRELLQTGDDLRAAAVDESISTDAAINRLDRKAIDLRRELTRVDMPRRSMQQVTTSHYERLMMAKKRHTENPRHVIGVRTGITDLDLLLDGLRAGVTTLAGATGSGKTAMMLQMSLFASLAGFLRAGPAAAHVNLFSGEMTEEQLTNRMLSGLTGVPVRCLERGSFNAAQEEKIVDALHALEQSHRLTLEGGARLNTGQIRQRVRTLVSDSELDLLVLDGLLQIEALKIDTRDSERRQQYVAQQRRDLIEDIMNDLEDIGISYNLPILLTHQLSRAPAGRQNKRPVLADLAEANFVEQKSAVVLFLYREGYYDPLATDPNAAEIIVAKNRHGETGTIHMSFDKQYTRFLNGDKVHTSFGGRP